jgi:sulfide:quinone oxidoreductase
VAGFEPDRDSVVLEDGERIAYRTLVVAPGIQLNWHGIEGLSETLGRNGVTSNYKFDLAPYTWELVQNLRGGRAVFTQPPMPIKCAGAPQKAMYLSCDYWRRQRRLDDVQVDFFNAGGVLFGVPDYVPALESYVEGYSANAEGPWMACRSGSAAARTHAPRSSAGPDCLSWLGQRLSGLAIVSPPLPLP